MADAASIRSEKSSRVGNSTSFNNRIRAYASSIGHGCPALLTSKSTHQRTSFFKADISCSKESFHSFNVGGAQSVSDCGKLVDIMLFGNSRPNRIVFLGSSSLPFANPWASCPCCFVCARCSLPKRAALLSLRVGYVSSTCFCRDQSGSERVPLAINDLNNCTLSFFVFAATRSESGLATASSDQICFRETIISHSSLLDDCPQVWSTTARIEQIANGIVCHGRPECKEKSRLLCP